MVSQVEVLKERLCKLEQQNKQEVLTLIEILSNLTFFGEIKQLNCLFAKNGQCTFYHIKKDQKNRLPVVGECRVESCKERSLHYHIELSNVTCSICQKSNFDPITHQVYQK